MIDLDKNKTFCPYPFKAIIANADGRVVQPCCRWDDNDKKEHNIRLDKGDQLKDFSNFWQDVRNKMIKGQPVANCTKCYKQESNGNYSMRQSAIKSFYDADFSRSYRGPKSTGKPMYEPELVYIEIETGRFCNLKCRSCGPQLSTSWDEDIKSNRDAMTNFFGNPDDPPTYWKEKINPINESIAKFDYNTVKNVTEIKVTGGEPFLSDSFLKFLNNLVEWDIAKNVILDVFTNCSFFPKEKYWSLLPKFKKVHINLSLDGVGAEAEFIRKKSKWDTVLKVSKHWEDLALRNDTIFLHISYTISLFNVLSFKKFMLWAHTHFDRKLIDKCITGYDEEGYEQYEHGDFVQTTHLIGPDYLCLSNVSDKVKVKLLDDLKLQQKEMHKELESSGWGKKTFVRHLTKIWYRELERTINGSGTDLTDIFKSKSKMFDNIRKENWKEVFPKLAKILDE